MVGHGSATGMCRACKVELQRRAALTQNAAHLKAADYAAMIEGVAAQAQRVTDWTAGVVTHHGDAMILNDPHIPKHSPLVFRRLAIVALLEGVRTLIIDGDWGDFDEISTHHGDAQPTPPQDTIYRTLAIFDALLAVFDRIIAIGGNHDVIRMTKMIERAVRSRNGDARALAQLEQDAVEALSYEDRFLRLMERHTAERLAQNADKIVWRPETHCYVQGPEGTDKWLVTHQRPGSRNATTELNNIYQREQCNVVGAHTHLWGERIAPNGRHVLAQMGCASPRVFSRYANRHDTGYPEWTLGFAMIKNGALQAYPMNPHLVRWSEIEAAYAARLAA